MTDSRSAGTGVYYQREDYAGFFRRGTAAIIDLIVLLLLGLAASFCWYVLSRGETQFSGFGLLWIAAGYLYLAILKPAKVRTLGYILSGLRVVNLQGQRPSWLTMTCRFLLFITGAFSWWLDFAWLVSDPNRQTLRDKLAGTYVIRAGARPIGAGAIGFTTYQLLGLSLLLREVRRESEG